MDKPEVLVGSIEDEFKERLLVFVASGCVANAEPGIDELVTAFKAKIEEECWQAFELAQSLSFAQERSTLDEEKSRFREESDRFNRRVQAFVEHEKAHNEKHHTK